MSRRPFFLLAGALALAVVIAGCGIIDYYFLPPPEDTAQELYESGMEYMKDKQYGDAAQAFIKLKDRYPFSPFTPKAEVALGDAYFLDGKYIQAVDAYKEFEAMHPSHEDTPYVLYQIGLASYNMFRSIDLRQDNVREALEYFYRVEETFPDSDYAKSSNEYVVKCRRVLAEHEIFVADFFWRTEQYGPAWKRYIYVVENYGDIADVRSYAKRRAEYSYYEYQKTLSEDERQEIQGSWKKWLKKWL
ncbi:MAG: outer membrane protein assembly factor BamD [Desulfovibrionaceae bacterium]|nr:outer membrane protein assembly factor BamD [Desulfovibrionaceae bacterium]